MNRTALGLAIALAASLLAVQANADRPPSTQCAEALFDAKIARLDMDTAAMERQHRAMTTGRATNPDETRAEFDQLRERLKADLAKCKRGETIQLPAQMTGWIADKRDFSKQVIHSGDTVICVSR
jgi:hypothetical protein